jgi:hypothetical protein
MYTIYYRDNEDIELYFPAIDGKIGKIGKIGTNNILYSDAHFSLVPMNNWGTKDNMAKL